MTIVKYVSSVVLHMTNKIIIIIIISYFQSLF